VHTDLLRGIRDRPEGDLAAHHSLRLEEGQQVHRNLRHNQKVRRTRGSQWVNRQETLLNGKARIRDYSLHAEEGLGAERMTRTAARQEAGRQADRRGSGRFHRRKSQLLHLTEEPIRRACIG
jgi:hypothetical protein